LDHKMEGLEKIELYVACRDLKNLDAFSKSDPQVRFYFKENDQWNLFGKTEVIENNSNPTFNTSFVIDSTWGAQHRLMFEVLDSDGETSFELIGKAETTVAEILGTKKKLLTLDLMGNESKLTGELVIRAENIRKASHMVSLQCTASNLVNKDGLFGKSDPFLKFYKIRQGGDQLLVHETEPIMNNLAPEWKLFKIQDYKLSENDHNTHFRVECWDYEENGNHQYIGGCETSLNDLRNGKLEFELHSFKEKKNNGALKFMNFALETENQPDQEVH